MSGIKPHKVLNGAHDPAKTGGMFNRNPKHKTFWNTAPELMRQDKRRQRQQEGAENATK